MINLVVALVAESRPLIDRFGLTEAAGSRGFRIYTGSDMRLVVTGLGRVAAAAGTAYLKGFGAGAGDEAWLNIGIAGHRDYPVGTGVHALSIADRATDRNWYPSHAVPLPGIGCRIVSVDRPETEYPDEAVYDMEAAAYYATAMRFSPAELGQVYKIISDNRATPTHHLTRARISELIAAQLDTIAAIVITLNQLAAELIAAGPPAPSVARFTARWHFTESQEQELRALLRQWAIRAPGQAVWSEQLNRCPSAKSALAELQQRLTLPTSIGSGGVPPKQ